MKPEIVMKHEKRNMKNEVMINKSLPYIMHIDLNSCFAIIEQQANRLLRGKPVAVPAYDTPRGMVIASSYEAKAKGVKLGVNVAQARALAQGIVVLTPDPAKYREAHRLFKEVLLEYSPDVVPKSIDEFVIDFSKSKFLKKSRESLAANREKNDSSSRLATRDSRLLHNHLILELGREIKEKIRERLGEWVTVNIGIAPNRFLAKYAAGFNKPDGMTLIDHTNLLEKYEGMKLTDLPGINTRYRARLRACGIYTPLDFLHADKHVLQKQVFKSIHGVHWYRRLRGYEADAVVFSQKSIGHQYALSEKTMETEKLERLLMKLCEKTGRRLRKSNYYATGIHLYLGFVQDSTQYAVDSPQPRYSQDREIYKFQSEHQGATTPYTLNLVPYSWHHGEKVQHRLYSTQDIYEAAKRLLHGAEITSRVRIMSVHVYGLYPWKPLQTSLFDLQPLDKVRCQGSSLTAESSTKSVEGRKRVSDAVDAINNRYGEFVITPAMMLDMQGAILDRIAFGQVRDL
jgi:DNA polymerase-4